MSKNTSTFLRYAAIVGNILYMLWIIRNGIDEGFRATVVQKISYAGILILLALDSVLLYKKPKH